MVCFTFIYSDQEKYASISMYLDREVITGVIKHFEGLQCFDAAAVVGDIQGIKELVKLLNEHSCLPSIFSKKELNTLCHCVAQNLKKYTKYMHFERMERYNNVHLYIYIYIPVQPNPLSFLKKMLGEYARTSACAA